MYTNSFGSPEPLKSAKKSCETSLVWSQDRTSATSISNAAASLCARSSVSVPRLNADRCALCHAPSLKRSSERLQLEDRVSVDDYYKEPKTGSKISVPQRSPYTFLLITNAQDPFIAAMGSMRKCYDVSSGLINT